MTLSNVPASVRARLQDLAARRKEDFQWVLTRYAQERVCHRLAESAHADAFVVKGATLFTLWCGHPHRRTKDLDLLSSGAPNIRRMEAVFREILATNVDPDGLAFDETSIIGSRIRAEEQYEAVRLKFTGRLGNARIPMQVDVGFGDAVVPPPETVVFPTMLDLPAPRLKAYRRETAIAEKFEAMTTLGLANSRLKDFYDVDFLAQNFAFDGAILVHAITATFARRATPVPTTTPLALTTAFSEDPAKQTQWKAFSTRSALDATPHLGAVVDRIHAFLAPPTAAAAMGTAFNLAWAPRGPWR